MSRYRTPLLQFYGTRVVPNYLANNRPSCAEYKGGLREYMCETRDFDRAHARSYGTVARAEPTLVTPILVGEFSKAFHYTAKRLASCRTALDTCPLSIFGHVDLASLIDESSFTRVCTLRREKFYRFTARG